MAEGDDETAELRAPSSRPPASPSAHAVSFHVQSPLPPVAQMEGYERLLPGATDRWFALIERGAEDRRKDRREVFLFTLVGQLIAFMVIMSIVALSAYAIFCGHAAAGATIASAGLSSGTIALVFARRRKK